MAKNSGATASEPCWYPNRTREGEGNKAHRDLAWMVGEIVLAWNAAHTTLYLIFSDLFTNQEEDKARAIWSLLYSDRAQRELLEVTATAKLRDKKQLLKAVLWCTQALQKLSSYRNDAAHVGMHADPKFGVQHRQFGARLPAIERLENNPVPKYWKSLRGDLHAIESYAISIDTALLLDRPHPFCRKPRLQLLPPQKRRTRRKAHPQKKGK
ncbi:hypothetical protein [Parasphingopyxis marina]|uniref:Uncharacterized protein n=1 Tax=Parasphingopyxis marina TaxID=2761622 RepID=A0A842I252_9SPHN|nr:hypothetical protein [Parasphingopyxis marina]MBC2778330.1 hypothetical protein [Parasphingopyxis marina]